MKITAEAKVGRLGRFSVFSSVAGPAEVPDSVSIISGAPDGEPQPMHYFDSRGFKRLFVMALEGSTWKIWRVPLGEGLRTLLTSPDADLIALLAGQAARSPPLTWTTWARCPAFDAAYQPRRDNGQGLTSSETNPSPDLLDPLFEVGNLPRSCRDLPKAVLQVHCGQRTGW